MKYQIGVNIAHDKNYILLDPQPRKGNMAFKGDLMNLPCEDGECTEILAVGIMDYINFQDLEAILQKWLQKIRINGIIKMGGTDLLELARATANRNLSVADFNTAMTGKSSIHSCEEFKDRLRNMGLHIKRVYFNGLSFVVEFSKT
jgi:hypothetical protein